MHENFPNSTSHLSDPFPLWIATLYLTIFLKFLYIQICRRHHIIPTFRWSTQAYRKTVTCIACRSNFGREKWSWGLTLGPIMRRRAQIRTDPLEGDTTCHSDHRLAVWTAKDRAILARNFGASTHRLCEKKRSPVPRTWVAASIIGAVQRTSPRPSTAWCFQMLFWFGCTWIVLSPLSVSSVLFP